MNHYSNTQGRKGDEMKSLNCLGLAALYTFAGIGMRTFVGEGHSDVVRLGAALGSGFCFGAAPLLGILGLVYIMLPGRLKQ
jgi:hypothetical protein